MRWALGAVTIVLAVGAARTASANCARPVGYGLDEVDGGVVIRLEDFATRACPDKDGLLRENVATGEVVRIDACASDVDAGAYDPDKNGMPFFDACVPPGTYRYGFARPFECLPSACSTAYYAEITVSRASACVAPVQPKVKSTPWGSSRNVCTYGGRMSRALTGLVLVFALFIFSILWAVRRAVRKKQKKPTP